MNNVVEIKLVFESFGIGVGASALALASGKHSWCDGYS